MAYINHFSLLVAIIIVATLAPLRSHGCACGCNVFDIGTHAMLPVGQGLTTFAEYDFLNQDMNWHGVSSAPGANNDDKRIRTDYYTVGAQYMFSPAWGIITEMPWWDRYVRMADEHGDMMSAQHASMGDVRVRALYTGFSPDASSGVTFGLKLPTGDYKYAGFDRDMEIGTGSTDVLAGGFLRGHLLEEADLDWFMSGQLDQPVLTQGSYRPGSEVDLSAGVSYSGLRMERCSMSPMLQAIGAHRWSDSGAAANAANSGYDRLLVAPGVEFGFGNFRLYADLALPVFQRVTGDQLVAQELVTVKVSYSY